MEKMIIGIDEVGRGPLAGPVTVGAVGMEHAFYARALQDGLFAGVRDSKKMTVSSRQHWAKEMKKMRRNGEAIFAVASVSAHSIDERGISCALQSALARALRTLAVHPQSSTILLDGGLRAPASYQHQRTIIGGDDLEVLISLASIVAKVHRDAYLTRLALHYPHYGFEKHKGYGTRAHQEAIIKWGICPEHRKSFLQYEK